MQLQSCYIAPQASGLQCGAAQRASATLHKP
jgi:hypothetical protein